jgi:hypothetical protein
MDGKELFDRIMGLIRQEAHDARESAGYGGRWDDGGASRLEDQIRFFQYGLEGILPPEWEKYKDQVRKESDPDYAQYLNLKRKFG